MSGKKDECHSPQEMAYELKDREKNLRYWASEVSGATSPETCGSARFDNSSVLNFQFLQDLRKWFPGRECLHIPGHIVWGLRLHVAEVPTGAGHR